MTSLGSTTPSELPNLRPLSSTILHLLVITIVITRFGVCKREMRVCEQRRGDNWLINPQHPELGESCCTSRSRCAMIRECLVTELASGGVDRNRSLAGDEEPLVPTSIGLEMSRQEWEQVVFPSIFGDPAAARSRADDQCHIKPDENA